jgi:hypothetical protein
VVDDRAFIALLRSIPQMSDDQRDDSDDALWQLQQAVEEQKRILALQADLIARLRSELKDVKK